MAPNPGYQSGHGTRQRMQQRVVHAPHFRQTGTFNMLIEPSPMLATGRIS